MGKINKLIGLLFSLPLSFLGSCSHEQLELYQGSANIRIESNSYQDTLKSCTCWISADELVIKIGNVQLSGIVIDIVGRDGIYQLTANFEKDFEKDSTKGIIPIDSEVVEIKYSSDGKKIAIDGFLTLRSSWQPPSANIRGLSLEGDFTCKLEKPNREEF